jgi:outer membrane protein OmpA-like peptidoglycan-associated protein
MFVAISLPALVALASCGVHKDANNAANSAKSAQQSAAQAQRAAQQSGHSAQMAQGAQQAQAQQQRTLASQLGTTERQGAGSKVIVVTTGLLFPKGSADVSPDARAKLGEVASAIKKDPQPNAVIVQGYTDDTGSAETNAELSERRALAVADLLESDGIPKDRVTTQGLGPQYPVSHASTPEGRAMNRRVEIVIRPEAQRTTQPGR